jgi:RHS repeat-associated protein
VDDLNPTGYAQVVEEVVNGTVERQYTYGLQRISEAQSISGTWTQSFYGYDGGGSVRQLTNSSAAITDTYNYDAFGNLLNSTGTTPNNYLYRGEQYDSDLNLYYLRARYVNPVTGRFMSLDPEGGKLRIPATLHKYLYVGANPIGFIDPTGRALADYAGPGAIAISAIAKFAPEVNIVGTAEVTNGTATMYVDLIEGTVRNPFQIITLLTEAATALQASELYIVTSFENERLLNIAVERYGFVTVGGVEVWWTSL